VINDREGRLEIEPAESQIEILRRELRWEPWKALAATAAAAIVFMAAVLAVSAWWPPAPQQIDVYLDIRPAVSQK
jgi:hypothetical protein